MEPDGACEKFKDEVVDGMVALLREGVTTKIPTVLILIPTYK
jgi:hypothetical protein